MSNYTLYPKFSECMINTLNYSSCYTLHITVNSIVFLDDTMQKNLIIPLLNILQTKEKLFLYFKQKCNGLNFHSSTIEFFFFFFN